MFKYDNNEAYFIAKNNNGVVEKPGIHITFEDYGQRVIDTLLKNKPWLSEDVLQDPQVTKFDKQLAKEKGIHAWLILPLIAQG